MTHRVRPGTDPIDDDASDTAAVRLEHRHTPLLSVIAVDVTTFLSDVVTGASERAKGGSATPSTKLGGHRMSTGHRLADGERIPPTANATGQPYSA